MRNSAQKTTLLMVAFSLIALSFFPMAAAHGDEHAPVEFAGVVGRYSGAQPGPLLIVPYVDVPPLCGTAPTQGALVALGDDVFLTFFVTGVGLQVLLDLPQDASSGYAGLAVDTHDASRALILMQESAISLHSLVGVVWNETTTTVRTGALGLPYIIPGTGGHDMGVSLEGGGILLDHDNASAAGSSCAGPDRSHRTFVFSAQVLPESVEPGRVVHIVALFDPDVPYFLPRPIDGSTRVLQANLYLARPGEDIASLRDALEPRARFEDVAPLVVLGVGLVLVTRRPGGSKR